MGDEPTNVNGPRPPSGREVEGRERMNSLVQKPPSAAVEGWGSGRLIHRGAEGGAGWVVEVGGDQGEEGAEGG
ncbi:hypothetical protein GCM10009743_63390 [Kribbella swartbergensis]